MILILPTQEHNIYISPHVSVIPDSFQQYLMVFWLQLFDFLSCCATYVHAKHLQPCQTIWDPMDHRPPGSSVHGMFQTRILKGLLCPSTGDLPDPGIEPASLMSSALAGRFFTASATWEAQFWLFHFTSVLFSHSVVSDFLRTYGLQHARPPCSSSTGRVYSNSCPLSWWFHPTISSSVIPSPLAFNLSQNQGLFKWVSSSYQVAKVLQFQLQHQSFQWIFSADFL